MKMVRSEFKILGMYVAMSIAQGGRIWLSNSSSDCLQLYHYW